MPTANTKAQQIEDTWCFCTSNCFLWCFCSWSWAIFLDVENKWECPMKHTEADKVVVANSNRDLEKCVLLRFTKISATCEKCSISAQRVHFVSIILSMQFTGRIPFNWRKLNWCFCNNEKFSSNQLLLKCLPIASNKQHHWKAKFNKCWSYFQVFLGILLQAHMLVVVSKCVWGKMIRSSGCKVIAILLVSALLCTDLSHCEAHVEYSVLRKWIMLSELSCLV